MTLRTKLQNVAVPNTPIFLFNRANAAYVDGTSRRIARDLTYPIGLVCIACILILFSAIVYRDYAVVTALQDRGVSTESAILSRWIEYGTRVGKSYKVAFFVLIGSTTISVEQRIGADLYTRLVEGQSVQVRMLPDNPQVARLSGPFADDDATLQASVVMAVVWLIWSIGVGFAIQMMRRNRRLAEHGRLIYGTVSGCKFFQSKLGILFQLTYSFRSPQTDRILMRSETTSRADLDRGDVPGGGAIVAILYLNDQTYRVM